MIKAKITKNNMINLPSKIRKKLSIQPGDEISFLISSDGIILVPVRDLFSLINPNELEKTKEIIQEIHEERKLDREKCDK